MTDTAIANTILKQIGGGALFMIGAKRKTAIENGVRFSVGRVSSGFANTITIKINGQDLYDFRATYQRGQSERVIKEYVDVWTDQLHACIEESTGMVTQVPRIRGINA